MANEDYTSRVPYYTFSETLEAQEAELETNPLMQRLNAYRKTYEGDPHRPIYHYINPEAMLNDPNGLCFWQGRWHLFYQAYPPEDTRQHWGHAISDDLIHWRDLPYANLPEPGKVLFLRGDACRRRPCDRDVSRHGCRQYGCRVKRSVAPELGEGVRRSGHPCEARGRHDPGLPRL